MQPLRSALAMATALMLMSRAGRVRDCLLTRAHDGGALR